MIKIKGISKTGARPENTRLVLLSIVAIKIMQQSGSDKTMML